MLKKILLSSVVSFGVAVGVVSGGAVAQTHHEMSTDSPQFQSIEQPLWVKGAVTASGLALIGLELWWFLLSKPKYQQAQAKQGIQEITLKERI